MPTEPIVEALTYWEEVQWASLGVALSVVMPFLLAIVKRLWPSSDVNSIGDVWNFVAPYLALGAFSIVVGVLVAAAANFESNELALLGGFAWDKTLQMAKITWIDA